MIPNNAPKVSINNNYYILIKYRGQQIQDIKQHYVNILALPKAAVMGINANLLMEIKNCV